MPGLEQYLAIFRCIQPGHQHTFTIEPGRRSIGTFTSSAVRPQHGSNANLSFATIEFSGGDLLWVSSLSESDSIQIYSALAGPASKLPHDDKFYQIQAGNVIGVADCRFAVEFHKADNKIESTQILESLQEQCLSDTDVVVQSPSGPIDLISPSLGPLTSSNGAIPKIPATTSAKASAGAEIVSETDSIPPPVKSVPKTPARAGFLSPTNRRLPVLSTPMKDEHDTTSSPVAVRAVGDTGLASPTCEHKPAPHRLTLESSSEHVTADAFTSSAPRQSASDVLPKPQELLTSPVPKRSASHIPASLSSPPIRRRSSVSEHQDEDEPMSPPLGSSGEVYEEITPPEPLPEPAHPITTSILHSHTLPIATPGTSQNRIASTPGTELSTNRKRRRVGLVAPKPLPTFASDEKESDSVESGRATPVADDNVYSVANGHDSFSRSTEPDNVRKSDVGSPKAETSKNSVLTPPEAEISTNDDAGLPEKQASNINKEMADNTFEEARSLSSRIWSRKVQPREEMHNEQLDVSKKDGIIPLRAEDHKDMPHNKVETAHSFSSRRRSRRVQSQEEMNNDQIEVVTSTTEDAKKDHEEMPHARLETGHSLSNRRRSKKPQPQEDIHEDQLKSVSNRKTKKSSSDSQEQQPRTKSKMTQSKLKGSPARSEDTSAVKSDWKPIVMFTGIANEDLLKIVSDLGGSVTEELGEANVLVCDNKIRRTVKFMCGIATSNAIVTDQWLIDSRKAGRFIETGRYIVADKASERQFGCCLRDSLQAENRRVLLRGKSFWISPECNPKPADFTPIIEFSGGSVVNQDPSTLSKDVFIISMSSLGQQNKTLVSLGHTVYDKELVLTGILRQSFDKDEFRIDLESSPPKPKRRKR